MVAQVVVDVIHSNVAKPFSYLIPKGMQPVVGSRVNVPLGRRTVDGFVVGLIDESELPPELPPEKLKPISKMLDEYPALLPAMLELAREIAGETHCPLSEALRLMLPAAMRTGRIKQKQETVAVLACDDAEAEAAKMKRAPKRAMLLRLLADGRPRSLNELSQLVQNPREGLKALEEAGLVQLVQREVFRSPYGEEDEKPSTQPLLTDGQREALDSMLPAMEAGEGAFLLHGVTGSGKTEVYLAMAN
ncbi:MAG: hypothetical protein E7323_12970, partial [Clostridiales bacterium]|nr:hypothetical protein [Clostridiales bacterium]